MSRCGEGDGRPHRRPLLPPGGRRAAGRPRAQPERRAALVRAVRDLRAGWLIWRVGACIRLERVFVICLCGCVCTLRKQRAVLRFLGRLSCVFVNITNNSGNALVLEAVMAAIQQHYPEVAPERIPMQVSGAEWKDWIYVHVQWSGCVVDTGGSEHLPPFPVVLAQAPEHFELEATTRAIEVKHVK